MLKISWDAGHAGFGVTPGKRALDNSMYEWDFNDGVVRYAMEALSHYENIEQLRVDDPTGRVDVSLSERANRVNAWGSNLHISVHGNAATPSANGIETFVHPSASKENRDTALHIHNYIINRTNRRNRGLKEADFQILRATKMDSLLIEGGFMTNPEELELMKTNDYRKTVGQAIADAIVTKFGLKRKTDPVPKVEPVFFHGNDVIAKVKVIADNVNIHSAPDFNSAVIRKAVKGEVFDVYTNQNDWHAIGGANWVFGNNGSNLSLINYRVIVDNLSYPQARDLVPELQKRFGGSNVWGEPK